MINEYNYGAVHELRLARPPANAFDLNLILALTERVRALPSEGKSAIVLSGAPGFFSGGFDMPALLELDREGVRRFVRSFLELQYVIAISPIPIVAAITGHCAAGAVELALYCDYRIMARGSYLIGLNEVQVGLFAGRSTYGALRRLVGPRHADRLLAGGALIGPERALATGLVDALADADRVVLDAQDYATTLTKFPLNAYRATRQLVREDLVKLLEGGTRKDACDELVDSIMSAEAQATLRARVAQMQQKRQ
jgi:3,2-trans-enoyl-CoA isomerase